MLDLYAKDLIFWRSVLFDMLWPLVAEQRPCSPGYITAQLMQMFPVMELPSCASTSMTTSMTILAILEDSNAMQQ